MAKMHNPFILVMIILVPSVGVADNFICPRILNPNDVAFDGKQVIDIPNSSVSILRFDDNFQGVQIGFAYFGPIKGEAGAWLQNERVWMDPAWSGDVRSICYGQKGDVVYLASGSSNAIYKIALSRKESELVASGDLISEKQPVGTSIDLAPCRTNAQKLCAVKYHYLSGEFISETEILL